MARPRLNPHMRFSDVMPILEQADFYGRLKFKCIDERAAIHMCHRMNQCRRAMHDYDETCRLDRFVIRVVGNEVWLAPRPTPDMSKAMDWNGAPLGQRIDDTTEEYARLYAEEKRKAQENFEALKNKPLDLDTE